MISLHQVSRVYQSKGRAPVHALRGIDLEIERHGFLAVTGPSGCGKSTLLHLLGALDTPSGGSIRVDGLDLHEADDASRTRYRRRDVGIVFQFFNLMPNLTVLENTTLPLLLQGVAEPDAASRARDLLGRVGLSGRLDHLQHQLSGGEMQRTAIARALVHDPKLLIADEPTGNLDSANAAHVLEILQSIHEDRLCTLVVVTHSEEVAQGAGRRIAMRDGRIVGDSA